MSEGSARALVVAVGEHSECGKTLQLLRGAGEEQTPLQETLEVVATAIGKVGAGVAICCFLALVIKWVGGIRGGGAGGVVLSLSAYRSQSYRSSLPPLPPSVGWSQPPSLFLPSPQVDGREPWLPHQGDQQ